MLFYQNQNSFRRDHFEYRVFDREGMTAHFHACYELIYALRGASALSVEQRELRLREGEMCLLQPNQIHAFRPEDGGALWICVFSTDMVESFHSAASGKAFPDPVFTPSRWLIGMLPADENTGFESPFLLRSFLYLACHDFFVQARSMPASGNPDNSAAHRILAYISQNYQQDITLSHLAGRFGMNRSYISSLISALTKQNLRTYLNGYRLEHAKQLLAGTQLSVTDVAYECGFGNIRTFNRAFAAQENMSPRAYRDLKKKNGAQ